MKNGIKSPPKVSVVIPAYNHEAFVEKAVISAISQTLKDLEIICIDDASQDSTPQILEGLSSKDERIKFFKNEQNLGAAQTINKGIRESKGEFIAILNSDDKFHETRLETLTRIAERKKLDFLITDIELIDQNDEVIRDKGHWWVEWYEDLKSAFIQSGDIIATLLGGNVSITTSNFFIRRYVFENIGFFYNYRYVSDYEFLLRFLSDRADKFHYLTEKKLLYYRLHSSNTIKECPLNANKETFEILLRWAPELFNDRVWEKIRRFSQYLKVIEGYIEQELNIELRRQCDALIQEKDEEFNKVKDILNKNLADLKHENHRLQEEKKGLLKEIEQLRLEIQRDKLEIQGLNKEKIGLLQEIENLRLEVQRDKLEIQKLQEEALRALSNVYNSTSFKLGYAILEPARILSKFLGHEKDKDKK